MKPINKKDLSNEKFDMLIKPNINKVYKFLCAYTKDFDLAQDLMQNCLIKAYLNLSNLKDECKVSAWLYKIAINCAKDYFKQNNPTLHYDVNCIKDNAVENIDVKYDISMCLMMLESGDREILILKDMMGYTYSEISDFLDISVSNVGARLYRARDKLKEIIYKTEYCSREE